MEDKKIDETVETSSRRSFLVKAGALTAGMTLAGGFLGTFVGSQAEATTYPIPYEKLDIDKVRQRGYDGYFEAGCMYGAAKALIVSLREVSGPDSEWNKIPEDMFKYGAGGIAGWGTLCGALNGALYVLALATGSQVGTVGNELMKWYTKFPFPSTKLDTYSGYLNQVTSIANSPLCHVSVSTWSAESGFGISSTEKKQRCAKLTGDTAAKAAELLNKLLNTKVPFKPAERFIASTDFCMTCHATGNVNPGTEANSKIQLNNEQGKMDCLECHGNEHQDHSVPEFNDDCSICHS